MRSIDTMGKIVEIVAKATQNPLFMQNVKTMLLRFFGVFLLFGFTFFLTHHYAPEIIGQYDFIRVFLLVVGSISILGMDQSVLYFAGILHKSRNQGEFKRIYFKMLVMIVVISLVILLIFLVLGRRLIADFLNDNTIYPVLMRSVAVLSLYSITLFNTEVFRAVNKIYTAELFRNTFKYISLFAGALLLLGTGRERYLTDMFLVGFIFLAVISTGMILRFFKSAEGSDERLDFSMAHIAKKSYPIAISSMAIFLLTTIDVVFLKKFHGDKMVAQYGVSVKFMTIVSMLIQMININVSTRIASYFHAREFGPLQTVVRDSARMMALFVLPVVVVVYVFAHQILLLFGPEYVVAEHAMRIAILGQGATALFGTASVYLNMTAKQQHFQVVLVLAVVVNFTLNLLFIPEQGMTGAATAYVISILSWNAATTWIAYRYDKIKLFLH